MGAFFKRFIFSFHFYLGQGASHNFTLLSLCTSAAYLERLGQQDKAAERQAEAEAVFRSMPLLQQRSTAAFFKGMALRRARTLGADHARARRTQQLALFMASVLAEQGSELQDSEC